MKTTLCIVLAAWLAAPVLVAADDRAAELLAQARERIGGATLDTVTSLTARGEIRRVFGERETSGELTIDLAAPDRLRRTEVMGFPGGPSLTRVAALDGGVLWEDTTQRGGGGMMRIAPGGGASGSAMAGGPGGWGRGPREITEDDRERFREMQRQRLEADRQRYLLAVLLRTDAPVTYVGVAEAEDGRAEVLEIQTDEGAPMRLFLDADTSLPLMLTYEGVMPRMRVMRRGEGPPATGTTGGPNEPPQRVTFELRLDEYRSVDGLLLPHRFTQSVDGVANEEWTIDRYRLNPSFKPGTFGKKP